MGMIGYAMNHAKEHERSEGISTLEKREDINGHLISETEQCVATPKRNDKELSFVRISQNHQQIKKNDLAINKDDRVHALC